MSIVTSEFPFSRCIKKIDGGGGQDAFLYNVEIGNFPEILMSLTPLHTFFFLLYVG